MDPALVLQTWPTNCSTNRGTRSFLTTARWSDTRIPCLTFREIQVRSRSTNKSKSKNKNTSGRKGGSISINRGRSRSESKSKRKSRRVALSLLLAHHLLVNLSRSSRVHGLEYTIIDLTIAPIRPNNTKSVNSSMWHLGHKRKTLFLPSAYE